MPPLPPPDIPLMHGSSLPTLSGKLLPWLLGQPAWGGLPGGPELLFLRALLLGPLQARPSPQQKHRPFSRPRDLSTTAAQGPRECWRLSGWALVLLSHAGKIGAPSPSPSRAVGSCKLISVQISEQPPPPGRSAFQLVAAAHEAPCWNTCQCLKEAHCLRREPRSLRRAEAWPPDALGQTSFRASPLDF